MNGTFLISEWRKIKNPVMVETNATFFNEESYNSCNGWNVQNIFNQRKKSCNGGQWSEWMKLVCLHNVYMLFAYTMYMSLELKTKHDIKPYPVWPPSWKKRKDLNELINVGCIYPPCHRSILLYSESIDQVNYLLWPNEHYLIYHIDITIIVV